MLKTLEIQRKNRVSKTLHVQPEGYQEPHNVGPQVHLALAHRWDFNLKSFKCVLQAIPLGQPVHMTKKKNKKNNI